jgi:hypothetical protein
VVRNARTTESSALRSCPSQSSSRQQHLGKSDWPDSEIRSLCTMTAPNAPVSSAFAAGRRVSLSGFGGSSVASPGENAARFVLRRVKARRVLSKPLGSNLNRLEVSQYEAPDRDTQSSEVLLLEVRPFQSHLPRLRADYEQNGKLLRR